MVCVFYCAVEYGQLQKREYCYSLPAAVRCGPVFCSELTMGFCSASLGLPALKMKDLLKIIYYKFYLYN